jgi:hypothetical protein
LFEHRSHQLTEDLARADAEANVKEKDGYDPSKWVRSF